MILTRRVTRVEGLVALGRALRAEGLAVGEAAPPLEGSALADLPALEDSA